VCVCVVKITNVAMTRNVLHLEITAYQMIAQFSECQSQSVEGVKCVQNGSPSCLLRILGYFRRSIVNYEQLG